MNQNQEHLRMECEKIAAAPWTGISSYWAAKHILNLLSQLDSITAERDRFAVQISRMLIGEKP